MKTTMTLLLAVLLSLGFAVTSFAAGTDGTILGSSHDLSGKNIGSDEVCIFCHTPHNAVDSSGNGVPLWSMTDSPSSTFIPYTSTTFDGGTVTALAGPTLVCMSCHDGVVAMNNALMTNVDPLDDPAEAVMGSNSSALIGIDLSNDHPVGFDYALSLANDNGEGVGGATEIKPLTSPIGSVTIADVLWGTIMTCASCHDVHNPGAGGYFLLQTNFKSGLCLACHAK